MDRIFIAQTVDLDTGQVNTTHGRSFRDAVRGNKLAIRWQVTLLNAGIAADVAGCACCVKAVRADGQTVPVSGTVSGNVITAILTEECFAVLGKLKCFFDLTDSSGTVIMTAAKLELDVVMGQTDTVVNPGDAFPDFSALIGAMTMTHVNADLVDVTKSEAGQYTVEYVDGESHTISIIGETMTIT